MALQQSRFFDDVNNDRVYQSEQFAEYFRMFLTDGIFNGGTSLQVSATGSGLSAKIDYGAAMIQGYMFWLKTDDQGLFTLPFAAANTLSRIDRVVLRLDRSLTVRNIELKILKGNPSAAPQPPALERTGNIYELALARITIRANALKVEPSDIVDERYNQAVCGLVNSLITLDTSTFETRANTILNTLANQGYLPLHATADNSEKLGGQLPAYYSPVTHNHSGTYATAAQGTKADNALPSASYTAADVLSKLKTVDGSGSGLDADLFDGKESTDFLRNKYANGYYGISFGDGTDISWFRSTMNGILPYSTGSSSNLGSGGDWAWNYIYGRFLYLYNGLGHCAISPLGDFSARFECGSNGYIDIGPKNTSTCHIYTDRTSFYFNKELLVNGTGVSMNGHTHTSAQISDLWPTRVSTATPSGTGYEGQIWVQY